MKKQISLFMNMSDEEISAILASESLEQRQYKSGEILLLAGERPSKIGMLLEGAVQIVKEDAEGNRTLVAALGDGELFAESICCAMVEESPVTVIADQNSKIAWLDINEIMSSQARGDELYARVIKNLLLIIARKNMFLQSRMELARIKSVRGKVLHYLSTFEQGQSGEIIIPLNREEMADYLLVERSALSHELMKMKRDGIIDYKKNKFRLL